MLATKLALAGWLLLQSYNVPFSPRAAAGATCTFDFTPITMWYNWDDDDCSSDVTSYTSDATNELDRDSDGTVSRVGSQAVISDDLAGAGGGGLSGSACAIWVPAAATGSYFRIDNPNDASPLGIDATSGRVGIEIQFPANANCNGAGDPWPCCPSSCDPDGDGSGSATIIEATVGDIRGRVLFATGDIDFLWLDGSNDAASTATSCSGWVTADSDVHVVEFEWNASSSIKVYLDGTECGSDSTGVGTISISTTDDVVIGAYSTTDTHDFVIDRVAWSDDPSTDFNNVFITQGCQNYVAP